MKRLCNMHIISQSGIIILIIADINRLTACESQFQKINILCGIKTKATSYPHRRLLFSIKLCLLYSKKQKSEIVVGITYNLNVRKNEGRKSG